MAFFDSSSLSCHFRPFTGVQNGNQREVMTKCGNFFRPEETKGREDSIWFHTSESSLRSLRCSRKPSELPSVTRIASASPTFGCAQQWRVDWMTVEAAVSAALGKLRAARLPLQGCFGAREATYTRRKDLNGAAHRFSCRDVNVGQASASTRPTHDFVFQSVAQR